MKRSILLQITFGLLAIVFLGACSKSGSNNPKPQNNTPVLAVTSLNITSGPYNASVIVTGTGFSTTPADDKVFFNGKAATVTAATATQLTATVPLGAGTGNVTVSVNNSAPVSGPTFTYQLSAIVTTFAGSSASGSSDGTGINASFDKPVGLCVDANDNLYVTDINNHLIRKITPDGVVTTFAGNTAGGNTNGTGKGASFHGPVAISADKDGNFYVADFDNNLIRKITPGAVVTTFAGAGGNGVSNGTGIQVAFTGPAGTAVDSKGNVYVSEFFSSLIRKITPDGTTSTFAGGALGTALDGTGMSASFTYPQGITIDNTDNLYLADTNEDLVRKITTPGAVVSTYAGSYGNTPFNVPAGVCIDKNGIVYVADSGNNLIRKVTQDNIITVLAGTGTSGMTDDTGNKATFNNPLGVVADSKGNIYVADSGNHVIRKISMQ